MSLKNPSNADWIARADAVRERLARYGLTISTGAEWKGGKPVAMSVELSPQVYIALCEMLVSDVESLLMDEAFGKDEWDA